jgi:hypothetical protein
MIDRRLRRARSRPAVCLNHGMDAETAARLWAETWSRAWPQRDAEAIAALYADTSVYRSPAFARPYSGLAGVRRYLGENLPVEENMSRRTSSAGSASRSSRATAPRSNGGAVGESRGRNSPSQE